MSLKRFIFAITGATGPIVGLRVLRELSRACEVHVIISATSFSIIRDETGIDWTGDDEAGVQEKIRAFAGSDLIHYYGDRNFHSPVASGSFRTDGMFVAPCSMKTLAGIACGYANGLVERAADVTIKEGRPLVLCPRETPFSAIHLENMLKLSRIGVKIVPPVIGFYHRPEGLDDVIDFIAGKVLDAMGVEHRLFRRWGE
ncbi:MAG: UbiX family flavin prenyltransferase [Nitrospiraceae bacterium]|nr:UbiX family flavin prenyltransferase [Nitrospiraceae bacterium]